MKYLIENQELWIVDEELGIQLRSPAPEEQKTLYYPNGTLRLEAHYTDDRLHGSSRFFSVTGTLLSTSWFYCGVAQGRALHYYPSGKLFSLQRFKDGARVGAQEYYYEDGSLKTLMPYDASGLLHGTVKLNALDGSLKRARTYNHGVFLE